MHELSRVMGLIAMLVAATNCAPSYDGCGPGAIETDMSTAALTGEGIDPDTGDLRPGSYVLSTTYLEIKPGLGQERFDEVIADILNDLAEREGVVASSATGSDSCGTARTLTVWRDEAAMYGFVSGKPHMRAVGAVSEISRGGSVVMHWRGTEKDANWEEAGRQLAAFEGRRY